MPNTPRYARGRGRRNPLAIRPVAFAYQLDNAIQLDENPNAAKLGARFSETASARSLARNVAASTLENAEGMLADFPGRDSLGRRNTRMARRSFA